MKILAFNGSPRMKRGNTEKILGPFLEGAKEAGAEVEVVYLRRMKLQPCVGCFNCWFRTPGICAINDDIHMLRDKLMHADVIIFATPVYLFSCSGYMKILIDRLLFPLTMPEFLLVDDRVYHPIRFPERKWKSILIACGAFDGEDVFKPLIDMYERAIHNSINVKGKSAFISAGEITIGFSELFTDQHISLDCTTFFCTIKNAGHEFVIQNGYLSPDALQTINKPLYHYFGITRLQAIEKINEIISISKSNYILPDTLSRYK